MASGIQGLASPNNPYVPERNLSYSRSIDVPFRALAGLGGAFQDAAKIIYGDEEAKTEEAKAALAKHAGEYIAKKEAFVDRVRNGEIPEFQNTYARQWFFGADAAQNLSEFSDEMKSMIPDLAKAQGKDGTFIAPGDFDGRAAKLWDEKYATRYSSTTERGKVVIGNSLPAVLAQTRADFIDHRKIEENALLHERVTKKGAEIVAKLADPLAFATPDGFMTAVAAWKEHWTQVNENVGTRDLTKMQLAAITSGLGSIPDTRTAILAMPLVKQLAFGGTGTIGNDIEAQNYINIYTTALINRGDTLRADVNSRRQEKLSQLYQQFDNALGTDIYDKRREGMNPAGLIDMARGWINSNIPPELADFRDELNTYADKRINQQEGSVVIQAPNSASAQQRKELGDFLEDKIHSGYDMSSAISGLDEGALDGDRRRHLLGLSASIQSGYAQLQQATDFDRSNKSIKQPLQSQLTGNRAMDQFAASRANEVIEGLQSDFFAKMLEAARPKEGPDGTSVMATPQDLNVLAGRLGDEYKKKAQQTVDDLVKGEDDARSELQRLGTFRLGVSDFDIDKAKQFVSPQYLQTQLTQLEQRANPLNDFGEAGKLGLLSTEQYRAKIEAGLLAKRAGGGPIGEAKKYDPVTPEESQRALDTFKDVYADEAAKIRQEVARSKASDQLAPRLQRLAAQLAAGVGSGTVTGEQAKTTAAPGAATTPQVAAAEKLAAEAEPPWSPSLRKMNWAYASSDAKATNARLDESFGSEMRSLKFTGALQSAVESYLDSSMRYRAEDPSRPTAGLFTMTPSIYDAMNNVRAAAIDVADSKEMNAGVRSATVTQLGGMAGLFRPEEWLVGNATLAVPEALAVRFRERFALNATPQPWEKDRFATNTERFMATMMAPRSVKLAPGTDPFFTDFGFKDRAELDAWKLDGRLLQLAGSAYVGVPPEQLDNFYLGQVRAMQRNNRR